MAVYGAHQGDDAARGGFPLVAKDRWIEGAAVLSIAADGPQEAPALLSRPMDAILVCVQLSGSQAQYAVTVGNQMTVCELKAGQAVLIDLAVPAFFLGKTAVRSIYIGIERHVVEAIAYNAGSDHVAAFDMLRTAASQPLNDTVLLDLCGSMSTAIDRKDRCSTYFQRQLILALVAYLLRSRSGAGDAIAGECGGLAPWQVRRAKELMKRDLRRPPAVREIARACGLSANHFSRAFRHSIGIAPRGWLNLERISRAKQLMRTSTLSLADVALECGYADQSHFTRSFSQLAHVSPGRWRRAAGRTEDENVGDDFSAASSLSES